MWINKFIAHTGYCSRRDADKLVEEGRVTVNDEAAVKTQHVSETDVVKIDDKYIAPPKRHRIYIAVNKPVGIVCTTETNIENNVIEFVGHEERIFPIGRMDRESSGLLFLTNDGDIVNRFTEEEFGVEKEYFVRLDQKITYDFIQKLLHEGIPLEGKLVKAIRVVKTGPKALKITILQDMRRQIRRMCSYCGFRVFKCERIRIMHIHVRDIPPGDWRYLTRHEVLKMFRSLNYHPAQKWLLPGETNEALEQEVREFLPEEIPVANRPDFQPEYRDESRENQQRPRDNRGGYRQEQRGGGGYPNRYDNRGGYQQPRDNRYDNRGGYQQQPPRDNRYDNRYDNRGGYQQQPPRDNRYDNRYDNRGGYQQPPRDNRYDNRGGYQQPPRDNRYDNRGGYQQAPRDNRYDNRYDNRGGYPQQPRDNRYENPYGAPGREEENQSNQTPRNNDDRYQGRYAYRYEQRDNRFAPRDNNGPQRPYNREGGEGYDSQRYQPRYPNRYDPRDSSYPSPHGGNTDNPEGSNQPPMERRAPPRAENRRPLWRAKPDEEATGGGEDQG